MALASAAINDTITAVDEEIKALRIRRGALYTDLTDALMSEAGIELHKTVITFGTYHISEGKRGLVRLCHACRDGNGDAYLQIRVAVFKANGEPGRRLATPWRGRWKVAE